MTSAAAASTAPVSVPARPGTALGVLAAISTSHMINDMMQSLILALYPILKGGFNLSFSQIGLITLTYQLTASLFQPLIGLYTDRRPVAYALPFGMSFTLCGLLLLAYAPNYALLLLASALIGTGSSIFHPESSRVARAASGGRYGFAQSFFQVGGNTGSALGPLAAAAVIAPFGQHSVAWFCAVALVGITLLTGVSRWHLAHRMAFPAAARSGPASTLPARTVAMAIGILLLLIFSKFFYVAGLSSFYTFYLIDKFGVSVQSSQYLLFVFLLASAIGTLLGGVLVDRLGQKPVIWVSILGIAPFALALPYVNLFWTVTFTVLIGLILSSAFSAILVYAQELIPGKVGMVSGLFFGLAFGMGGLGAALLGVLADHTSIEFVYRVIAFLPLIGMVTAFLPKVGKGHR
jgi:FSR family fosmidomycin resistance protein-like MFS transporter